jgi:hypothetical protein
MSSGAENGNKAKRMLFHADFRGDDRLNIDLSGNGGALFTANTWLKATVRARGWYAVINLVCLALFAGSAVEFFTLSIRQYDGLKYTFMIFAMLSAFTAWFLAATLVWMFKSRIVPAKQIKTQDETLLAPQWDDPRAHTHERTKINNND